MQAKAQELRRQRLDEVFDDEMPIEAESAPVPSSPPRKKYEPRSTVPRLSKSYVREMTMPEVPQNMSDSSIIPSPGVTVVRREKTYLDHESGNDGEGDDSVLMGDMRASKEEEELANILLDVQSSLEAPRLRAPAPTTPAAPGSVDSIGSPGVVIAPRGGNDEYADETFDADRSAFETGEVRALQKVPKKRGNGSLLGDCGSGADGKASPSAQKKKDRLEAGRAYAKAQREKRRAAVQKQKEEKEQAEKAKKARLLALDLNRKKLRTAPAPETALKRFKILQKEFADMQENKRVMPERAYSQHAFKVGVVGDDVGAAASKAMDSLGAKEEILASKAMQERISQGKPPLDPAASVDVAGTILDGEVAGGEEGFDMKALLKEEEQESTRESVTPKERTTADDSSAAVSPLKSSVMAAAKAGFGTLKPGVKRPLSRTAPASATRTTGTVRDHSVPRSPRASVTSATKTRKRSSTSTTRTIKTAPAAGGGATAKSRSVAGAKKPAAATITATQTSPKTVGAKSSPRSTITTRTTRGGVKTTKTTKSRAPAPAAADTLDLLDQSDIVVKPTVTRSSAASAYDRATARREAAAKKADTKKFGEKSSAKPSPLSGAMPESLSPTSSSKMQRGKAFPINTRAGGWKSPAERVRAWKKDKEASNESLSSVRLSQEEKETIAVEGLQDRETSPKRVTDLSNQLKDLTSQIGKRVEADQAIQNSIDVSDPEQVKARLAIEISNSMFYQRESQHERAPAAGGDILEMDSDGVYEDTCDHDSDLENSATFEKLPSPSSARRPQSSYGKRSPDPSPGSMGKSGAAFNVGLSAEGLVAVGTTPSGSVATSTSPVNSRASAARGVRASSDYEVQDELEVMEDVLTGGSHSRDASFEMEAQDDVIMADDDEDFIDDVATARSPGQDSAISMDQIEEIEEERDPSMSWLDKKGSMESAKEYNAKHPSVRASAAARKHNEDVSELVTDPLAGEFADYINTVSGAAGTEVAAQMMEMPRGRTSGAAKTVSVTSAEESTEAATAGSTSRVKVLETEQENILDEIDRIEEEHVRELQRIEAENRGSDYLSPFDIMKQTRQTAASMKAQDDEELQHKATMDMIADRNKLNQAFDVAAEKARGNINALDDTAPESPLPSTGRYTKDSTPEEVRNAALADVKSEEDKVKRSFRPNFNVDNLDIPSIREKRRMEIEAAVRKEREENMNSPFRGPDLRNAGKLASELGGTYEPTAAGNGLEGMKKGSKALSWHEKVQRELAAGEQAREYEDEMKREIELNAAYMEEDDDDDDDDDDDETRVVNLFALELAQHKEAKRKAMVSKHSSDLSKQAQDHALLVAKEGDQEAEIFADAIAAANHSVVSNKENVGENVSIASNNNATVGAVQQAGKEPSFWDSMQYVRSPMERKYNHSDIPEGVPVFDGVDVESILLQSLTVAFQPDEFLRKEREKAAPYNPKNDIRDALRKVHGKDTCMDNVLDVGSSAEKPSAAAGGGEESTSPAAGMPSSPSRGSGLKARLTPGELRAKMAAELKRQEEIHGYALELSALEQAQAVQQASYLVEKVIQQAGQDVGEMKQQQELVLQQQAYELSLTTAVNSVQAALQEQTQHHEAKVKELETRIKQQEWMEQQQRIRQSHPPPATRSGASKTSKSNTHSSSSAAYKGSSSSEVMSSRDEDDYSVQFENESQYSGMGTIQTSPNKSMNRSIPSILDEIHASADLEDDSVAYTIEDQSNIGRGVRHGDDSTVGEIEDDDSIRRSKGFSESEYSDVFDDLDGTRDNADDSMSVSGSGSTNDGIKAVKAPLSSRPVISFTSPTRRQKLDKSKSTGDGKDPTRSSTSIGSGGNRSSGGSNAVKFHQDTTSPKRRRGKGHVASSLDSAITMSSADESDKRDKLAAGGVGTRDSNDMTAQMLGEYRAEMEQRLRSQDKALKMRIHFLKTRRAQKLASIEEKRQALTKAALKEGKSNSSKQRAAMRDLDRDETAVNGEYDESRAELERERWTTNARAYRELRKFNSLKRDMESSSMRGFIRGEGPVSTPLTPDRGNRRGGVQIGSSDRDKSWARSKPSFGASSDGYSSLESSPSTASKSEKSSSSSSSSGDPNALSMSMLSTGRSVMSNLTTSAEKPPLGSATKSTPGGVPTAGSGDSGGNGGGIAIKSPPPSIQKQQETEESVSLSESAIKAHLASKNIGDTLKAPIQTASPIKSAMTTPAQKPSPHADTINSTDTLDQLERSIEIRTKRIDGMKSHLDSLHEREDRLQQLKEKQEEKAKLIALEKELSLKVASEQLYRDLSASQIKRLAAAGALPANLVPPLEDITEGSTNAALAALRASADNSMVDAAGGQDDDWRLRHLSEEERGRVKVLTSALSAHDPQEDEVAQSELAAMEDSWGSRDSMQDMREETSHVASSLVAEASGEVRMQENSAGIAETVHGGHGALGARIVQQKASVKIQSSFRRYRAGVRFKVLKTLSDEARSDLEAAEGAFDGHLRGDLVHEHERLVRVQDDALDNSWASDSSGASAALRDPEEDENGAEALQTAVMRLGDAVKARDLAAKKKAEKERAAEASHIAASINRYNDAAAHAQQSATIAEERVKALDAKIDEVLNKKKPSPDKASPGPSPTHSHARVHASKMQAARDGVVPVPGLLSTIRDKQIVEELEQLDAQDDSSVEFSVGEPESLPGSSTSSPRNHAASTNRSAALESSGVLSTSGISEANASDMLSAASVSMSPERAKKDKISNSAIKSPPPSVDLPTALEASYASVQSNISNAASASSSFDASASIGAMEAAARKKEESTKSTTADTGDGNDDDRVEEEEDASWMSAKDSMESAKGYKEEHPSLKEKIADAAVKQEKEREKSAKTNSLLLHQKEGEEEQAPTVEEMNAKSFLEESVEDWGDDEESDKLAKNLSKEEDTGLETFKDHTADEHAAQEDATAEVDEGSDFEIEGEADDEDEEDFGNGAAGKVMDFSAGHTHKEHHSKEDTATAKEYATGDFKDEGEANEAEKADKDEVEYLASEVSEEPDFAVGLDKDDGENAEVDEDEGQTMVPPTPDTSMTQSPSTPARDTQLAEDRLTAVDSSPTKSITDSVASVSASASASASVAKKEGASVTTLSLSQQETVGWGDANRLPKMQFSESDPSDNATTTATATATSGKDKDGEGRQSLEGDGDVTTTHFSVETLGSDMDPRNSSSIDGDLGNLTAISGIHPGSSVDSGSLVSSASDAAALSAAAAPNNEEQEEEEKGAIWVEEEEEKSVPEELDESLSELEESQLSEAADLPAPTNSLPPPRVPAPADEQGTATALEAQKDEEQKEQSLGSLTGLPSLSVPKPIAAMEDEDEDLYEFDSSPAPSSSTEGAQAPLAPVSATTGSASATGAGDASQTPVISTSLSQPLDWSEGVAFAAGALLQSSGMTQVLRAMQDPTFVIQGGVFFTPELVQQVTSQQEGASAAELLATGQVVADRFNEVLASLHEKRHASANKVRKGPKGGHRYGLGEAFAAETHPLTVEALANTLTECLRTQQASVSEVLTGNKHLLELVEVDAIDDFKREFSSSLAAAADEITDIILARALVDASSAFEDELDDVDITTK